MRYTYIAVEGLIGAGKTTLAKRLAQDLGARIVLEEFDENPFLPRFYEEPDRYAFSVELSFLAQRYHQLKRITEQDLFTPFTVADYSLGKSLVFGRVTLPQDEYTLFRDLYQIMYSDLPQPELIMYLHLDLERLRGRIRDRGRTYEQQISDSYLSHLQEHYLDHLQKLRNTRVLVVELKDVDLLLNEQAYKRLKGFLEVEIPVGIKVVSL